MKTSSIVQRRSHRSLGLWMGAWAFLATVGCFSTVDTKDLKCSTQKGCPRGYECRASRCELPGVDGGGDGKGDGAGDGLADRPAAMIEAGLTDLIISRGFEDVGGNVGVDVSPDHAEPSLSAFDASPDHAEASLPALDGESTPACSNCGQDGPSYDSAPDRSERDGLGTPAAEDAPIPWQAPDVFDAAPDLKGAGDADGARGICGPRLCDSPLDNDCSGKPDNQDEACTACTVGDARSCTTNRDGSCATGKQTCVRTADNSSVAWGECQAPSPGKPDCRSSADNNCNGVPDQQEAVCTTCIVGTLEPCSTAKPGICASGTHSCAYAPDYSSVGWGACLGASPGAKDCCHAADSDCNGKPDNQEAPCNTCVVNSTQPCNTHPEDGIGTCRAGSQTCVQAPDCSDSHWTACAGDVDRSPTEACGPKAPDSNCNGVPGDGEGANCLTTATVAGRTVKLFKTQVAGTGPVLECVGKCSYSYQAFGSCASQIRVLGYAATGPTDKYDSVTIPGKSCSTSCGCTTCSYSDPGSGPFYVVPNTLP